MREKLPSELGDEQDKATREGKTGGANPGVFLRNIIYRFLFRRKAGIKPTLLDNLPEHKVDKDNISKN